MKKRWQSYTTTENWNQNGRNYGMLVFQFLQHISICRIAGFGLFYRRKPQFVKQQFTQLLCGIDIEFLFRVGIDNGFTIRNPLSQHIAKLLQLLPVNQNASLFHFVKNAAQRKLHLFIEPGTLPVLFATKTNIFE